MTDCIDRRTGSAEAFLCDDANQAYRRASDETSWRRAHEAALEWREQAAAAYNEGERPCLESR